MRAETLEDLIAITDDSRGATHVYAAPEEEQNWIAVGQNAMLGLMVGSTKAIGDIDV